MQSFYWLVTEKKLSKYFNLKSILLNLHDFSCQYFLLRLSIESVKTFEDLSFQPD